MTLIDTIPENKKMLVLFRVEPGALGPDGREYIEEFCDFAQLQLQACAKPYIIWSIIPRFDKQLVEIEFQFAGKKLPANKANQYLNVFGDNLADFEDQLENHLEAIINQYFGR